MPNIVPQQQGRNLPALPEHLWDVPDAKANDDLKAGLGGSQMPPRLSIDGGVFRVITADEERELTRTDPETGVMVPIPALNVVLVAANHGRYKAFFGTQDAAGNWHHKKYDPNGEVQAPDCYSYDGVRPSPMSTAPQCESCAVCPHNMLGSVINDLGNKSKACSDGKLLAVLPYNVVKGQIPADDPRGTAYMVKVSATALSRNKEDRKADPANNTSLVEYVGLLSSYPLPNGSRKEIAMQRVVTTLFFDTAVSYPLLRFRLNGFLSPAEYDYVMKRAAGDDVKALVSELGVATAAQPAPAPAPAPAPRPALAPAPKPAQIAPPAAPAPAPATQAPPPAAEAPVRRRRVAAAAAPAAPAPAANGGSTKPPADDGFGLVEQGPPAAAAPPPARPQVPQVPVTGADIDAELAAVSNLW